MKRVFWLHNFKKIVPQNAARRCRVHWNANNANWFFLLMDDSWEPIENLDHSLKLIQEYWTLTIQQNRRPRTPPTILKLPGNLWKFSLHPAPQTIAQMTSGIPVTMRNMILAALSRTISPQMTTASYSTLTRALRTGRTLEWWLIFQNKGM